MTPRRVRDLLGRIGGISYPCDLDLLAFFHRHPRAVLTSERLTLYVGYQLSEVERSLETLIAAKLLTRLERPTAGARMYLLTSGGRLGGGLDALLRLVSTREGRLLALAALSRRPAGSSTPGRLEPPVGRVRRDRTPASTAKELRYA